MANDSDAPRDAVAPAARKEAPRWMTYAFGAEVFALVAIGALGVVRFVADVPASVEIAAPLAAGALGACVVHALRAEIWPCAKRPSPAR